MIFIGDLGAPLICLSDDVYATNDTILGAKVMGVNTQIALESGSECRHGIVRLQKFVLFLLNLRAFFKEKTHFQPWKSQNQPMDFQIL